MTSFQPAVRAALRTSAGQQFAGGDTSYSTELAKKLSSRWSAFLTQRKEKNAAFASREEGRRGEGGRGKVWAEAERVDGRQVVELNSGTPACETLLYHQSCSRKLGGTAFRTGYKARLPVHRGSANSERFDGLGCRKQCDGGSTGAFSLFSYRQ